MSSPAAQPTLATITTAGPADRCHSRLSNRRPRLQRCRPTAERIVFRRAARGLSMTNGYDNLLRRTILALRSSFSARPIWLRQRFPPANGQRCRQQHGHLHDLANSPLVYQIAFNQRMTTTKQWDYLNRLLSVSSAPSGASAVSFAYGYNDANQRTNATLADGSGWVYGYDVSARSTAGKRIGAMAPLWPASSLGTALTTSATGTRSAPVVTTRARICAPPTTPRRRAEPNHQPERARFLQVVRFRLLECHGVPLGK